MEEQEMVLVLARGKRREKEEQEKEEKEVEEEYQLDYDLEAVGYGRVENSKSKHLPLLQINVRGERRGETVTQGNDREEVKRRRGEDVELGGEGERRGAGYLEALSRERLKLEGADLIVQELKCNEGNAEEAVKEAMK